MNAQNPHSFAAPGEVTISGGRMQVVFHRSYARPIAKVWSALTTPERLEDWFGAARVDLRQGGTIQFTYPNGYSVDMKIFRLEPERALGWTWHLDGVDTQVLFELTPTDRGCDLTLTHSGLDLHGAASGVRMGWHAHLEGLVDALDGRATPWSVKTEREKALAPLYPKLAG